MSPRGSSERLAFLRREIARIESTGATGLPRSAPASRDYGPAPAFLSAARLAGGLHEIVPASAPDSHAALMLGLLLAASCGREKPASGLVLVVEDFVALETGAPYGPGLIEAGIDPGRLVIVRTHDARDTLRVMEEALKCAAVAAVLAESAVPERLYTLDASRRLTLAARAGGGAGMLVPLAFAGAAARVSSAAATRIEARRRSSSVAPVGDNRLGLPGPPLIGARLVKARGVFGFDPEKVHEVAFHAFSLHLPALPRHGPDPADAGFSRSA
ncbi:MAG: hypothetical protein H6870_14195 [Methylobacteriaceae bacterium]|nr:hypothetical protein [Methylobacteriaceae bacterium]